MTRILAIEPDRRQSATLTMLETESAISSLPVAEPSTPPAEATATTVNNETGAAAPLKKRRRPKAPRQDEWGFYDPQQCGLSVLIEKVNNAASSPKKPA